MRFQTSLGILVVSCVLCLPALCAQASQPQQQGDASTAPLQPITPLPPDASAPSAPASYGNGTRDATRVEPDTHALSGAETLSLGSLYYLRRTFDPALYFSEFGYTGVSGQSNTGSTARSTVGGTLDAERRWSRYDLVAIYNGSDAYYYPYAFYGPQNMPSHNLALSQQVRSQRWTFRLRDDFLYSWQAGFGSLFTGGPVMGNQSSTLTALQPSLNPSGTILTGFARQVTNLALGEVDYALSRRTTLTFTGSYGLLDFLDPGYLSSHRIGGRAGYNYSLSRRNSIALLYEYDRTSFSGTSSLFDSHLLQMSFGRKLTGRLALQIAAGPELSRFDNLGPSNTQQLSWTVSGTLAYQMPRTAYSLSYFRGVTPGSGVFLGAESETITASVNHQFTRFWSAFMNGGYALSKALIPNSVFAGSFDDWFVGGNLGKQIGRHVRLALSYEYQKQIIGRGACPVLSCGIKPAYQVFGVTLNWHPWSKGPQ
jgi:hypothetical protein